MSKCINGITYWNAILLLSDGDCVEYAVISNMKILNGFNGDLAISKIPSIFPVLLSNLNPKLEGIIGIIVHLRFVASVCPFNIGCNNILDPILNFIILLATLREPNLYEIYREIVTLSVSV